MHSVSKLAVLTNLFFVGLSVVVTNNSDNLFVREEKDAPLVEFSALFKNPCIVETGSIDVEEFIWHFRKSILQTWSNQQHVGVSNVVLSNDLVHAVKGSWWPQTFIRKQLF